MRVLAPLLFAAAACAAPPATPNPILDAASMQKLVNTTDNGKLYSIEDGEHLKLWVLHVWGTPEEMGKAHGTLLARHAYELFTKGLPEFYKGLGGQVPLGSLPEWLQKLLKEAIGAAVGPAINEALKYVFWREKKFLEQSQSQPLAELDAITDGMCDVIGCDKSKMIDQVRHMNMLPELIRMSCTMFGAWGSATPTGNLTQLRALDFGSGPFANYSLLTVYHPTGGQPFSTLGFPGFAGAVTGFSGKVALSEKVWETYNGTGMQKGHYDGLPVTGVIRDMIQFAQTKEEAIEFARNHTRTWAVFLGVGDAASQQFRAMGYREQDLNAYAPNNITEITHFAPLQDLVFIDKHPQPSHDQTTMPALMKKWYGNITGRDTAMYMPAEMETGDLHIAVYDYGVRKVWISLGWVDADGNYGPDGKVGKACFQPYLEFSMDALFNEKQ
eukprot:TRINITY_DN720_c0_g1_i1.p2 TRINITY_DN720_c0_g1~~TRINITY_DN720_c0_g1_i1.p2  ORF type:complete len:461 (+),score=198.90 TRINITY_DN720_c0_g1_i1:58-1383(+)